MNLLHRPILTKRDIILNWIPRITVVFIIAQTLPFKFSGAPETVALFEQLGMEPHGRYFIAVVELIAVIALLTPWYIIGAVISLSIISAANFLHFAKLGIEIDNDGGTLFWLSVVVLLNSIWIQYYWHRLRKRKKVFFEYSDKDTIDMMIE